MPTPLRVEALAGLDGAGLAAQLIGLCLGGKRGMDRVPITLALPLLNGLSASCEIQAAVASLKPS